MKSKPFIGLNLAAVLLISTFFIQTNNAESRELSKTNFAACKVKKNNKVVSDKKAEGGNLHLFSAFVYAGGFHAVCRMF